MASRKLVRDILLSKRFFCRQLVISQQVSNPSSRLRLLPANWVSGNRQFSVFINELSKQVKGEANRNCEFQQSVKELKDKMEELKGATEDLKVRTKKTNKQLYEQVDGVWTEAEATAKKVSSNLKKKFSAATEEVKDTFWIGKEESSESTATSAIDETDGTSGSKAAFGEETQQQSGTSDTANTSFGKFKASVSYVSPKVALAFQNLKETKPLDLAKKGYGIIEDELSGNPSKRKRLGYGTPSSTSSSTGARSTRTDIAVLPSKQSMWSKKWETFKHNMRGHPIFQRASGLSKPMVVKSQEFVEDALDGWHSSDNAAVHKFQEIMGHVFGETAAAVSLKKIRPRDEFFSMPEFVAEVQEVVKPVLNAYFKGDVELLKKYCSTEVIERCKAERKAFQSHGIFFDNKILHVSDVEVRETKMMGDIPIIIVAFETEQIYCVCDRHGSITEGGTDTIHTVFYAWAMEQVDVEELGEGALFPIWRLREMQQFGAKAFI